MRFLISGQSGTRSRRTVLGSTLASWQARLCEMACFAIALSVAARFAWGVVSSFPEDPSGRRCRAWHPPRASSAGHSRSPASSTCALRRHPCRRTLPPFVKRCRADPVLAADLRRPHAAFLLCQDRDNLFLGEPRLPHVRLLRDGLSFQMRDKSGLRSPPLRVTTPRPSSLQLEGRPPARVVHPTLPGRIPPQAALR
jgi:hypothetical protein